MRIGGPSLHDWEYERISEEEIEESRLQSFSIGDDEDDHEEDGEDDHEEHEGFNFSGDAMARRDDPESSHEAAHRMNKSGLTGKQQLACLTFLFDHDRAEGWSSAEMGAHPDFPLGPDRYVASRRLPELVRFKFASVVGQRKCNVNHTKAVVRRITAKGHLYILNRRSR